MRTLLSLLILWLVHVTNIFALDESSPYERLFLWAAYEVAVAAEGADKQKEIFPIQRGGITHAGSRPDRSMTFKEFISETSANRRPCNIEPPDPPARTLEQVANELRKDGWTGNLKPAVINRKFTGKGDKAYRQLFNYVIKMVNDKGGAAERKLGQARVRELNNMMKECAETVVRARSIDFLSWIPKTIKKDPPLGFGIKDEGKTRRLIVTKQAMPGSGRVVELIDLPATVNANSGEGGKLATSKGREDFRNWVNHYGDEDSRPQMKGRPTPEYGESAVSHWGTLNMWRKIERNIGAMCAP